MSQNQEYRLERIEDLAAIPPGRLDACLRDLQYAVELFHLAAGEGPHAKMGAVVWRDDNNHSVDMSMNGEMILTLSVTDSDGDEP